MKVLTLRDGTEYTLAFSIVLFLCKKTNSVHRSVNHFPIHVVIECPDGIISTFSCNSF